MVLSDGAKRFERGVFEIMRDFTKEPGDIIVDFAYDESGVVSLSFDGEKALIRGKTAANFYRMFTALSTHISKSAEPLEITEDFSFEIFGEMADCSRNSVLTVEAVKRYIRFLAASGMNMLMLYTEDTYEVSEYPYFGAYRGRYSAAELKEIDDYAAIFDVEVIPCIQTLAHLRTALKWGVFGKIRDTEDILLVDNDATYDFIEAEIRAVSSCVRSKRIHVGMDEAVRMGLGEYLKKNGYKNRRELIRKHLERVLEICGKYGLEAIMWSDMFFRALSPDDGYYDLPENIDSVPFDAGNCRLTYWDYYHPDYAFYKRYLKLHKDADPDCYFAGGGWTWNGLCPSYEIAFAASEPAVRACRDMKIKNVFVTLWQDNGAETSQMTGLPSVLYFAEMGYKGFVDMASLSDKLELLTGLPFEAYRLMGAGDCVPDRNPEEGVTPVKYALYQDPMIGLFDLHIKRGYNAHYGKLAKELSNLPVKNDLTEYYRALFECLSIKAELGLDITEAYRNDDRVSLRKTADEDIPECIAYLEKAKELREKIWLTESKPFGFEVIDIRFAGVISRLDYAKRRISDYLAGSVSTLPELEETRLPINPSVTGPVRANRWESIATASNITGL